MLIMSILVAIMWLTVSVLCLNCINDGYSAKTEWLKMSIVKRVFFLITLPVIYLLLGAWSAFEK